MKKDVAKTKIEFNVAELDLLKEICMNELYEIGNLHYKRFIDRPLIQKRIAELKNLLDKLAD